jgi:hypothetical protein
LRADGLDDHLRLCRRVRLRAVLVAHRGPRTRG